MKVEKIDGQDVNRKDKFGQWFIKGRLVGGTDLTEEQAIKLQEDADLNIEIEVALDYKAKRAEEYPTIREQLDLLYWDKINGTDLWKDKISSIKENNPKG